MRNSLYLTIFLLALAGSLLNGFEKEGEAAVENATKKVTLHFFYAENCPSCQKQEPFLKDLQQKYPRLDIIFHDVWQDKRSFEQMVAFSRAGGYEVVSTPTTALGSLIWVGFNPAVAVQIDAHVRFCLEKGCSDPLDRLKALKGASTSSERARASPGSSVAEKESSAIELPLLGRIDPEKLSLPVFTLILGLADSFNPCAFFVLIFLLGLLVHARSRKTILFIGGTFVFFSAFIYFLFMAAWLNLFLLAGQLAAITRGAGVVALLMAAINIKDFFFFKKGVSLSLSEQSRSRLFKRMRGLHKQTRIASILLGTVLLAVAANSYELLCTAGFPMVYTRLLTMYDFPSWKYYAYLCLYNFVYVIPLLLIVIGFTLTLGSRKMSEWQGRVLKLLSGIMMLMLGLVLVFDPDLLSNLYYSLGILVLSLMLTWLVNVLYHHRHLNPEAAEIKKQMPGEKIYRLEKRKVPKRKRDGKLGG